MSDVKPLTREEEDGYRNAAFEECDSTWSLREVQRLLATLDAERARADAALLEGVKAGIEAARIELLMLVNHWQALEAQYEDHGQIELRIRAIEQRQCYESAVKRIEKMCDPAAIARQVREGKRDV